MQDTLKQIVGDRFVLTGKDVAKWSSDWRGTLRWTPDCVVRPANTVEVSAVVAAAHAEGQAIVPVGGNTGLAGGTAAQGAIMLSTDRLNDIHFVKPAARIASVGAGVILDQLHSATAAHDLTFPMTFGARGSATLGGLLSTNAGGSNVLRYGNTRDLCLGIELVLPDGQIMNLMSQLHKDNTGLNLKHLFIGAEGTLGIITAAVVKLYPTPAARVTSLIAVDSLPVALNLLNALQSATAQAVEAFEYMPASFLAAYRAHAPQTPAPFDTTYDHIILLELGGGDAAPLSQALEDVLSVALKAGTVLDAVVAQSDNQRGALWAMREAAAEITFDGRPIQDNDICLPLDRVAPFLADAQTMLDHFEMPLETSIVAHLGDGNIHYAVYLPRNDADLYQRVMEGVEDLVAQHGGSFSAEHGIGLSKKPTMARRKDPVALATMRSIKRALDPKNIMNPGKVFPE